MQTGLRSKAFATLLFGNSVKKDRVLSDAAVMTGEGGDFGRRTICVITFPKAVPDTGVNMGDVDEDVYECFTCGAQFRSRQYCITREQELVEFNHADIPVVSKRGAESLEIYCSAACLGEHRKAVMAQEKCPVTRPGLGPIETCSRCATPFSTADWHRAYVESGEDPHGNVATPFFVEVLARLCPRCSGMTRKQGAEVDTVSENMADAR